MDTLVTLLQTPVNTILVLAGIALVFFTFFEISKGSVRPRKVSLQSSWIPVAIGGVLILGGLFYKPASATPAEPTEIPLAFTEAPPVLPSPTPPPTDTPGPTETAAPTEVPLTPTASPVPLKTFAEDCIDERIWRADSTDADALTAIPSQDNCLNLTALGIAALDGTLHLRAQASRAQIASGILTTVGDQSTVEFKVSVDELYIIYKDNPAYITFSISPQDNPMARTGSGRFKLQVKDTGNSPLILFMLADTNESNGNPLRTQHYLYGRTYEVRLVLRGVAMDIYINNIKLDETIGIPPGSKVLYIGYNLPLQAGVDATITDISIDGVKK